MPDKIAVAVIHGIGSQANKRPQVSDELTFSKRLHRKLRGRLGRRVMDNQVAWREVFWADILQDRQDAYLEAIRNQVEITSLRTLLVRNFADAVAFSRRGTAYLELQQRIDSTIADLRGDCDEGTPLVVLAHSFGGRIMSNYIWDLQRGQHDPTGDAFRDLTTMARFITFGCNLPLFTFAFPPEEVEPIAFPGESLPDRYFDEPWWTNYFDGDDLLGFPIAPIGPRYQALAEAGELSDVPIKVGGLFTGWNTLSHDRYWADRDFVRPVARTLKTLLRLRAG